MKKAIALLLAAAMAVSLAGCSGSSSGSASASTSSSAASGSSSGSGGIVSTKDTLNMELSADPGDISPYGLMSNGANTIKGQIMQPLFRPDDNNVFQPYIVESYEWKDDTHITLKLKDGITFSNGEQLTTEDVLYTFETCRDNSTYMTYVSHIDFDNTKIVDKLTIDVALNAPTAFFFCSECNINICCKKDMEADPSGQVTNPTGSGPYKVTEYVTGDHITLTYRDDYWNKTEQPGYIKTITLKFITEATQRTIALETGSVDYLMDVPSGDYDELKNNSSYTVVTEASTFTTTLNMNCTSASIFQDESLREAVATAVDSAAVTKVAYGELGTPAFSLFTSSFSGVTNGAERYNKGNYCKGDIASAKTIVDKYKAEHPDADMHITLLTNGATDYADALQVISNELSQIGFDPEIVSYEAALFFQAIYKANEGAFDIYMLRAGCASGMVSEIINNLYGATAPGLTGYKNEELSKLISEVIQISDDEAKTTELCDQIWEILQKSNSIIPVTQQLSCAAFDAKLQGVKHISFNSADWSTFYFN